MYLTTLILYVLFSVVNLDCFHAQPVTTVLSGTLSLKAMNNNQILTGTFDSGSNEMIVWKNADIVTRVTQFNDSFGVLINNNGVAAGLGSNGISQDDSLIIANAFGTFDVVATITGSAGWSSLTAINEQSSVVGNYSAGSGSSDWQAFLWTETNGVQFIEPTADTTYAYDVDEQNQVAGQILVGGSYHAMLWDNGVLTDIATLLNLKGHSTARYFDAQGQVLISEFANGATTYRWYNPATSSVVEIHDFPVGTYTQRIVPSKDGKVAFSWSSAALGPQLARWSQESGFEQATLPKNIVGITAISINQDGAIACTALTLPFYGSIAMLWSNESAPVSLHEHVPDSPSVSRIIAMNEDGQLLVRGDSDHWILEKTCVADLDNNGFRDVTDILILIGAWGQTDQGQCGIDLDGSGVVDVSDLLILVSSWGACE